MNWGGLRPIASRLSLDIVTIGSLAYATQLSAYHDDASSRSVMLLLCFSVVLTGATAGWTNRWTLSFPLAPLLVFQVLLQLYYSIAQRKRAIVSRCLVLASALMVLLAASLSILFTAVELPPVKGPYNVGIVDFHLPVTFAECDTCRNKLHEVLPVRLLYPTHDTPQETHYLNPATAVEFLRQNMLAAAPQPLERFGWMLHHWRLIRLARTKQNATLAASSDTNTMFPVILFSHGLSGTAEIYSYQSMGLASQGNVVLQLNHQDGSAPVVLLSNGTTVEFDNEIINLWREGRKLEYVRERRKQTETRVLELIAATEVLHRMNEEDNPALLGTTLSLRRRLDVDHTIFFGHSFGAATALTAAKRRPDLVHSVIAHDPAVDWMPDDSRRSLFPRHDEISNHLKANFTGDDTCVVDENAELSEGDCFVDSNEDITVSLHDMNALVLYSREWYERKWAGSSILHTLHVEHLPTSESNIFEVGVVNCHHTEFSDVSMLTPLWIARAVNLTGSPRSPIDSAEEIQERTSSFVQAVQQQSRH